MTEQNYANHRRFSVGFHYVLTAMLLIGLIVAVINIFRHSPHAGGFISAVLIALLFICVMFTAFLARTFALKAQDRAVRAEESLRHFILSGKPVDSRLTIGQIAALRFASDAELLPLSERAAAENLSTDDIKKAVKNWRSDTHRV
jgi:hypothetical protein